MANIDSLDVKIAEGKEIVERAIAKYNPSHKFALFSGGDDSLVSTHFMLEQVGGFDAVVHINTGIGIPEAREFVTDTCLEYGWQMKVYHAHNHHKPDGTPTPQVYEELVLKHGFPGPSHHTKMFNRLKGRQIARLVREHKTEVGERSAFHDRIFLGTGLRTHESDRRMLLKGEEIDREGAKVWVNPCLYWRREHLEEYRDRFDLEQNPVSQKLCESGECECAAFDTDGEKLEEVRLFYPDFASYIERLERKVKAQGFTWGWDESPPDWWCKGRKGKKFLPGCEPWEMLDDPDVDTEKTEKIICSGCIDKHEQRKAQPDDLDGILDELNVTVGDPDA